MTGLEMLTAAHLSTPIVVVVLRDRELAQIAQFQNTAMARQTASQLPDFDLAALCKAVGVSYLWLKSDADVPEVLGRARSVRNSGRPVLVEVEIDYSKATYFTRGVVRANLGRLPWRDRVRFVARALRRRVPNPTASRGGEKV
jgi:acetolactate synthase-1/2/3 large subunit